MLNTRSLAATALLGLCVFAAPAFAQNPTAAPAPAEGPATLQLPAIEGLRTDNEKISYMIGLQMANSLQQVKDYVDPATLAKAIQAGLSGEGKLMTDAQAQEVGMAFGQFMQRKQAAMIAEQGAKNLAEGEAFLASNKTKAGVQPAARDTVVVHYRGTFIDGREFDSSYARNEPATFPLAGVIPGWTEGVQLMPVGSKYVFWIPAALAYGPNGAGQDIPPNSALRFTVELLEVRPAA